MDGSVAVVVASGVKMALYAATLAIIVWGVGKALLTIFGCREADNNTDNFPSANGDSSSTLDTARTKLGSALATALSVLVAAEIIRILNIQTWSQLARVAAVIALRHLLRKDLDDEEKRIKERRRHNHSNDNDTTCSSDKNTS